MTTVRILLAPEAVVALRRPIAGRGGFQALLTAVQGQLVEPNLLELSPELIERLARYAGSYGRGGFQGRLDTVLVELSKLAKALEPLAA